MKETMKTWLIGIVTGMVIIIMAIISLAFWPTVPKSLVVQPYQDGYAQFVHIRGSEWTLRIGTEDGMLDLLGMYGITDCNTKKIFVHGDLDITNQRVSISHELLHAGTCDEAGHVHNKFFNSESDADHEGIYKISEYFSTLLHDNPDLAKYLYQ